jgi:hypothetical protein
MFNAADGTYAGTVTTDGEGWAVISDFPEGGWVTAAVPQDIYADATTSLTTVGDVALGAAIVRGTMQSQETVGGVDVTLTEPVPEGSERLIYSECRSGTGALNIGSATSIGLDVNPTCAADGLADIILLIGTRGLARDFTEHATVSVPLTGEAPAIDGSGTVTEYSDQFATHTVGWTNGLEVGSVGPRVALYRDGQVRYIARIGGFSGSDGRTEGIPFPDGVFDAAAPGLEVTSQGTFYRRLASIATVDAPLSDTFDVSTVLPYDAEGTATATEVPLSLTYGAPGDWQCGEVSGGLDAVAINVSLVVGGGGGAKGGGGGGETLLEWDIATSASTTIDFANFEFDPDLAAGWFPADAADGGSLSLEWASDSAHDWAELQSLPDPFAVFETYPQWVGDRCTFDGDRASWGATGGT